MAAVAPDLAARLAQRLPIFRQYLASGLLLLLGQLATVLLVQSSRHPVHESNGRQTHTAAAGRRNAERQTAALHN